MVRPLTLKEREELRKDILERPFLENSEAEMQILDNPERFAVDVLRKRMGEKTAPITGEALLGQPGEMQMILDFTGLRGSGSGIYFSFIYQAETSDIIGQF